MLKNSFLSRGFFVLSIILFGNAIYALAQFLMISFISKNEGINSLGNYALSISMLSPFFAFIYFGFRTILSADVENKINVEDLVKIRLFLIVFFGPLFISLIYLFFSYEQFLMVLLVFTLKAIESFSDLSYGAMHKKKIAIYQGFSLVARIFLSIIFFMICYKTTDNFFFSFGSICFAWLFTLLFFDLRVINFKINKMLNVNVKKESLLIFFKSGLYVTISALIGALVINIPVYSIGLLMDSSSVGVYSALYAFCAFINILCITLGQVSLSTMAEKFFVNDFRGFLLECALNISLVCLSVIFLIFLIFMFSGSFMPFFVGENISNLITSKLPWFLILALPMFIGQYLSYVITAVGQNQALVYSTIVSGAISMVASVSFIPMFGVMGGAFLLCIMGLIQVLIFGFVIKKTLSLKIKRSDL